MTIETIRKLKADRGNIRAELRAKIYATQNFQAEVDILRDRLDKVTGELEFELTEDLRECMKK